uniref:Uncharacterized protein n=1 Tax=Timema genevievae TaxID=629358 RepID=A0A7R9JUY9_TIMGE|nr:unnamed protein product [Timema genevievae]
MPHTVTKQRVKEAQAKFTTSQSSKVTHFSPGDLVWVRFVTHRKLKVVPGQIQHRISTVSYLVIVGGRSTPISTYLRLRDPKSVPIELSWEMVEQAMPAPMPTPTSYEPTPGSLIQPPSVADHSLSASLSTKTSMDSTPEALRWIPSMMPPGLQCLREYMHPRASSPNSALGAAPVTTRPGRQLEHQITSTEWENGGIAKDEGASLITFPIFKKELTTTRLVFDALPDNQTSVRCTSRPPD